MRSAWHGLLYGEPHPTGKRKPIYCSHEHHVHIFNCMQSHELCWVCTEQSGDKSYAVAIHSDGSPILTKNRWRFSPGIAGQRRTSDARLTSSVPPLFPTFTTQPFSAEKDHQNHHCYSPSSSVSSQKSIILAQNRQFYQSNSAQLKHSGVYWSRPSRLCAGGRGSGSNCAQNDL